MIAREIIVTAAKCRWSSNISSIPDINKSLAPNLADGIAMLQIENRAPVNPRQQHQPRCCVLCLFCATQC